MSLSIAHLGPPGTYAEAAALTYARWLNQTTQQIPQLCPCPSIAQTLRMTALGQSHYAVVPVENSLEGTVTVTLDTIWQLDNLEICQALVLPVVHGLVTTAHDLSLIKVVYSHPQALGQCQNWLERFLPQAQLIPTNSTTEALQLLNTDVTAAAIASPRAAQLYDLPVLVAAIQDHPDNCTRFWVLTQRGATEPPRSVSSYSSLAFSVPANVPGALVKPLQVFADRHINLTRIESRPSKRSLGDYVFFIDLEGSLSHPDVQSALVELAAYTKVLKVLGSYAMLQITGAAS